MNYGELMPAPQSRYSLIKMFGSSTISQPHNIQMLPLNVKITDNKFSPTHDLIKDEAANLAHMIET